jgi:DNA-binding transcriptional LysR family regulator
LEYFVAVAEEEHFTRAAERLIIAQPSLSRQVKDLEDALGVELFVRDSHGVTLTDAGRELLARARAIFSMTHRTIEAVRATAAGQRGRLRLGYYGPSFFNNHVTRFALEYFRAETPDVEVTAQELFSEEMTAALREGRIDVGISRAVTPAADIEQTLLVVEPLVVLVPNTDQLRLKPEIRFADLDGRNLLTFPRHRSRSVSERIAELARKFNVTWNTVRELSQLSSIAHYVALGEGIAVVPASSGQSPFHGVTTRAINDREATIDLFAVTRRGEQSQVVLRMMQLLQSPPEEFAEAHRFARIV